VAVDNDLGLRKSGIELFGGRRAELVAVRHDDVEAFQPELRHLGQPRPHVEAIGVAVHRRDGRDGLELRQQLQRAQVARVQDVVDAAEDVEHLGPQQAVRVRDDAEPHPSHLRAMSIFSSS
jgi:hypothetical protein